jgi:hypothetical protein
MGIWIQDKNYWYVTESLVEGMTEGNCLVCEKKLEEGEIEEVIQKENYKEAGICRTCRKKDV